MKKIVFICIIFLINLLNSCFLGGIPTLDARIYILLPIEINQSDVSVQIEDEWGYAHRGPAEDYQINYLYKYFSDSNFVNQININKITYLYDIGLNISDSPNSQMTYNVNIKINKNGKSYEYSCEMRLKNSKDGYSEYEIIPADDSGIDKIYILFWYHYWLQI